VSDLTQQGQALNDALAANGRHDAAGLQRALMQFVTALSDWAPLTAQINAALGPS